jgi:hypothetical protein
MIFLDNLQDNIHHILIGMSNLKILGRPFVSAVANSIANAYMKRSVPRLMNVTNKDIIKIPNTRTSTTTPRGGSPQGLQDRQELHTPATMWMTMSAVANANRKSVVQPINNNIKMANNKDIMKSPHT